jgi:phage gp36-like protein
VAYATTAEAIDLYGDDYILASVDRDDDGVADATAFSDALDQATSELNSYIAVRYDLPLSTVPAVLTRFCIDIAVYIASSSAVELTDEKKERYKAAIAWAKGVAKGDISLGTDDIPTGTDEEGGSVQTSYSARAFTRTKMAGLL